MNRSLPQRRGRKSFQTEQRPQTSVSRTVWNVGGMERSLRCGGTWVATVAEARSGRWHGAISLE